MRLDEYLLHGTIGPLDADESEWLATHVFTVDSDGEILRNGTVGPLAVLSGPVLPHPDFRIGTDLSPHSQAVALTELHHAYRAWLDKGKRDETLDDRASEVITAGSTHLGELTYYLSGSRRVLPLWSDGDYAECLALVQERIAAARQSGAHHVHWSRNEDAANSVEAEDLSDLGI
jgi:hypothetical protein